MKTPLTHVPGKITLLIALCCCALSARGASYQVLYNFTGGNDGAGPQAGLVQALNRNFYGTTVGGGSNGMGAVFEVTPGGGFRSVSMTASNGGPISPLIEVGGFLFGTTEAGGVSNNGTVFQIGPTNALSLVTLASFIVSNGDRPAHGALLTQSGTNFISTTLFGGPFDEGTIFRASPNGVVTNLAFFNGTNGASPDAGVIRASDGNLYGTTIGGGPFNLGTIFRLTPAGVLTNLVFFDGGGGREPHCALLEVDGNFYGTTRFGGADDQGTVFRMAPDGTLTPLAFFDSTHGAYPQGGLIRGPDGNLYGMTYLGGDNARGTIFRVGTNGPLEVVFSFAGTNGANPYGNLLQGSDGKLYGTASAGGAFNAGVVFRFSPATAACAPAPAGLASWWRGEGNALDSAGANNGTLVNGATFAPGIVGQAFSLDGINDYVTISDDPSLRVTNLTVAGWFNFAAINALRTLVSKTLGTGLSDSYIMWQTDGTLFGAVCDNGGCDQVSYAFNPVLGNWYHLAFTFDAFNHTETLYVNGTAVATVTTSKTISYDAHPVLIGAEYENDVPSYFVNGLIDEVSLFNRALSSNEIATIYAAGSSGMCPPPASSNSPPVLAAIGNKTAYEGQTLAFTATATDPDAPPETLTFSLDPGAPSGASITQNGDFSWTPSHPQVPSTNSVTIRVTDNGSPALSDTKTFTITAYGISTIEFIGTNYVTTEMDAFFYAQLRRTGETSGSASVRLRTFDETAQSLGSDFYGPVDQIFTFAPGETNKTVFVTYIVDNIQIEPEETFRMELSDPSSGAVLGAQMIAKVLILDDETTSGPGLGLNAQANDLKVQPDGKIVVAGVFQQVNGRPVNGPNPGHVARFLADGSADPTFATVPGPNSALNSIALQSDGKIIIGGDFDQVDGTNRRRVARLNANGSLDPTFDTSVGTDSSVWEVASQPDGKVLIGGAFTMVNGTNRNYMARLDSNGVLDTTFNIGSGFASLNAEAFTGIWALAVQTNGQILVGGFFQSYNGVPRNNLIRLNSDGSIDNTFVAQADALVNTIVLQPDGKILVGGWFTSVNGTPQTRITRLLANGTIDPNFNTSGAGPEATPWNIALQPDGKILVAGFFANWGGQTHGGLVRLNANGALDTSFAIGPGGNFGPFGQGVQTVVGVLPDGRIAVAGNFSVFNGVNRHRRFTVLNPDGSQNPEVVRWVQWRSENGGNNHWYAFTSRPGTWTNAENEALTYSGHLVSVNSTAEQTFLEQTFLTGRNKLRPFWTGLNDAASEGNFVWSSGESVSFTKWQALEPNGGIGENYGVVNWHYAAARGGLFSDAQGPGVFGAWNDVPPGGTINAGEASSPYFGIMETTNNPNLAFVPPGTFVMGSPTNAQACGTNESPQTTVTLTSGFWMSKYEVTQGDYLSLMSNNPSHFPGDLNRPVEQVSWYDAMHYCNALNSRERSAGRLPAGYAYRLPTEAEWEYSARAGTTTLWSFGDNPADLSNYGWHIGNSGCQYTNDPQCLTTGTTHPVGEKLPNPWGLYDMHGNVAEWCLDFLGNYAGGSITNPIGSMTNGVKIFRAPAWDFGDIYSRSACRWGLSGPSGGDDSIGFRVVLAPEPPSPMLVSPGSVWKYLDDGSNQGSATNWINPGFNDSSWASGFAQLGYGDGDEVTVVNGNRTDGSRIITTYFRRAFTATSVSNITSLTLGLLRDDGGVVFLNGAEVYRNNMPAGPIGFNTLAPTVAADDGTIFFTTNVNPARLVEGVNVLAVEIHQASATSSDISFDLYLDAARASGTAPTITCPSNIAASNTVGQCSAVVTYTVPAGSGSPTPTVTCAPTSGSTFFLGISTVTCTASNSFGATNCSFQVQVLDREPPNFFCTSNKTVECGTSWTFNQPTAFDNCNATGVTVVVTGTITNPICGGSYAATRTWRATDSSSNSAFCSQTVTVRDTTPPVVNCPTNFTVQCGTAWSFGVPTGSDTCSGQAVTIIDNGTTTNAACGHTYSATRSWLVIDGCTNATPCSQTVRVVDTIPPAIACATDILVPATGNIWLAGATNGTIGRVIDSAPAESPVQATGVVVTGGAAFQFEADGMASGGPTIPFAGPEGLDPTNEVFSQFYIFCHGPGPCTSEHGISDILAPDGSLVGLFLSDALPDLTAAPARLDFTTFASRNYTSLSPQLKQVFFIGDGVTTQAVHQTVIAPAGATRLFLGRSGGWNFYNDSGFFSVRVITAPTNRVVECGSPWNFDQPIANDACDGTNVTISIASTVTNALCGGSYSATRTWRATDSCSNSATCSQTVTVTDTTPPVVNCPTNFSVACGTPWNFGIPNGVDACSGQSLTTIITGTTTNALCGKTYSATRNFLILDGCSNATPCSQTVTVFDTTPPLITFCPSNLVVQCGDPWNFGQPIAFDACDNTNATITILNTVTNPVVGGTYTATRIWKATDACGNTNACSQAVTIVDTTPPLITCPSNIIAAEFPHDSSNAVVNYSLPAVADICDSAPTVSCAPPSGSLFSIGTKTVVCVAQDGSGNTNSCSFTVRVIPYRIRVVTSTADSGDGSLRQGILDANDCPGENMLIFQIPGPGPYTVNLSSALPAITGPLIIDGYSQTGVSNAPVVELKGNSEADGLVINTGPSIVQGLALNGFATAIRLEGNGGNIIRGNYIGTDITGSAAVGNAGYGIYIASPSNTIGGTTASAANVISANGSDGIHIDGLNAFGNVIAGNRIGTATDGTSPLGNGGSGIVVDSHGLPALQLAVNNSIGLNVPGGGNTIAFNTRNGITLTIDAGNGNAIRRNSISQNSLLGIDLGDDGVTLNDPNDADIGPNNFQNVPVLTDARSVDGVTTIEGTLNDVPSGIYEVDLFLNDMADPSGFGEGAQFLGTATVTVNAGQSNFFSFSKPLVGLPTQFVTATATDPNNNTSEFSAAIPMRTGPVLQAQPAGGQTNEGSNFVLCVTATGTQPITYQWRLNGVNLPNAPMCIGETQCCLSIPIVALANGGAYDVVVNNDVGTTITQPVPLIVIPTVLPGEPPPVTAIGDNIVDSVRIVGQNGSALGANKLATRERGEPLHAGKFGSNSVWYTWTPGKTGITTVQTEGSTFDTLLAIYEVTNPVVTVSNLTAVASDEDRGDFFTSSLRFNTIAGHTYYIAVDAYGLQGDFIVGGSRYGGGDFTLRWSEDPTLRLLPQIAVAPRSLTVGPGSNAIFSVIAQRVCGQGHTNCPDPDHFPDEMLPQLDYQWLFDGVAIPGQIGTILEIDNVQPSDLGVYTVQVTQRDRTVETDAAILQINDTDFGVQNVQAVDKFLDAANSSNPLRLGNFGTLFAADEGYNNNRANALAGLASGYSGFQIFPQSGIGKSEAAETNSCGVVRHASMWVPFIAAQDVLLRFTTTGTVYQTVLALYSRPNTNSPWSYIACDKDALVVAVQAYNVVQGGPNFLMGCDTVSNLVATNIQMQVSLFTNSADLAISQTVSPASLLPGNNLTYVLTVTNQGPSAATDVVITNSVPTGVTVLSATASQGSCSQVGSLVTCVLGNVPSGATASATVLVGPVGSTPLTNSAVVRSAVGDPNLANNTSTNITLPCSLPTLSIARSGASVVLSWPVAPCVFELQSTSRLDSPASTWTTIRTAPVVGNGTNNVTVGLSGTTQFFRLRLP